MADQVVVIRASGGFILHETSQPTPWVIAEHDKDTLATSKALLEKIVSILGLPVRVEVTDRFGGIPPASDEEEADHSGDFSLEKDELERI